MIINVRSRLTVILSLGLLLVSLPLFAQETLYPQGYNVLSNYHLSAGKVILAGTLTISRTIVNHGSLNLTGLYFSENLPPSFDIVDQRVTVNDIALDYSMVGPVRDHEVKGYDTYFWIIDSRGELAGIDRVINPGDSIDIAIDIKCIEVGEFILPSHSAVFYGNGTGFFSTSDSLMVEFVISLDVEDDTTIVPSSHSLVTTAYPNPFNSAVVIKYSGLRLKNKEVSLQIIDQLGRTIFEDQFISRKDQGQLFWRPGESVSSGIYFYKVTEGSRSSGGKVVLVK